VRARAYALARRTVDYVISGEEYDALEVGDIVTLTHAEIGADDTVCLVRELQVDASGLVGVSLLMLEDPARDLRRA
jgi:hypothetical protein